MIILNKNGLCNVGQLVLVYDVYHIHPRAYVQRHKLWEIPEEFTLESPNEVRIIL